MAAVGTGYDLYSATFSPEGRIFQVEYATKAVDNSGTLIGARCKDGVVFAVEKVVLSKMLKAGSNRRLVPVDRHCGLAMAGLIADARVLANTARSECHNYTHAYGEAMPVNTLGERMGLQMQEYTNYTAVRPYGATVMLGGWERTAGYQLWLVDPSGLAQGYTGTAAGKARAAAKTELEKLDLPNMTADALVTELARIVHKLHDETSNKKWELEMAWCCAASDNKFQLVPEQLRAQADERGRQLAEDSDDDSDSDDDM